VPGAGIRFLRATYPGDEVVSITGIRRDESPVRRLAAISATDTRLVDAYGRSGLAWHPLVDCHTLEVFALHARVGLLLHAATPCSAKPG